MPIVMDPLTLRLGLARDDLGLVGTQVSSSLVRHVCLLPASSRVFQQPVIAKRAASDWETHTRDFEAL